jgi:phosphoenolpyruvate carboxylase
MPAALRRDVRLLGRLLGQVIAESGGAELLEEVEHLRRLVIAARRSDRDERLAAALVASWSLERADQVARAFTCYFHLANLAEEHQRARALRERDRNRGELPESLPATVARIRGEHGEDRLQQLLAELEVHPVLTAHPTEARRRAVVTAIRRVGDQLERLDDPRCSDTEVREAERRLLEEIEVLWRTSQLRSTQVKPLDEVRAVMAVFDETLFRVVPRIYRGLDAALAGEDAGRRRPRAPAFIRFGSWVGGDRDGNPHVTAQLTREALAVHAEHALSGLETVARRVGRSLTADAQSTPPSAELAGRLELARRRDPERLHSIEARAPGEPHRVFLVHVADRIRATAASERALAYGSPDELLDDIGVAQRSLAAAGAGRLAFGGLQDLAWQVQTFGFHLAELEVRQHSRAHRRALAELRAGGRPSAETLEVLATFEAISELQHRFGVRACTRYVVSFAHGAEDIAAVYELAERAPGQAAAVLDVVPLFESAADLDRATSTLDAMIELEPMRRRLEQNGRRLEVMLGYSDSAKENGPLSATLALYDAQARLTDWAARHDVRLTLFHGRGGALGRGGGPANRAVLAQAPGSVAGRFKVTEQGEVVFARYGNPAIAARHLEQVASAVLLASTPALEERRAGSAERFRDLARRLEAPARRAYRELVESSGFASWFSLVSPLEELGRMRIGSRPARREQGESLDDLRAIPWVFAWSQTRLNLPGWYGVGSGLAAADPGELRRAFEEWPLFSTLLENVEMSLAKTDRKIATRYLNLGSRPDLSERVLAEYDLTTERVLAVTGHRRLLEDRRVLSWAVELRNPYVDALSHLQLRALGELRSGSTDASLERLLLLTVNGVAAGLQNTG